MAKHLTAQERSDKWLIENITPDTPHVANLAISCLRALQRDERQNMHLPSGMFRRLIEDNASPESARQALGLLPHLDNETMPNSVLGGT